MHTTTLYTTFLKITVKKKQGVQIKKKKKHRDVA